MFNRHIFNLNRYFLVGWLVLLSSSLSHAGDSNSWPFKCRDGLLSANRITVDQIMNEGREVSRGVPLEAAVAIKAEFCAKAPGDINGRYGGYILSTSDCERGELGFRFYKNKYYVTMANVSSLAGDSPITLAAQIFKIRGKWQLGPAFSNNLAGE